MKTRSAAAATGATAIAAALLFGPATVPAQTYPARAVRWVVPFPSGGAGDILVRKVAQRMAERLRQPFVVDNRPGAGNNIGTEVVARAMPDGYTLLMTSPANAINASLYPRLPFDFLADIAPVAGLGRLPNVMVVPLSVPAGTVEEFIGLAKAQPGRINMASAGTGTSTHLSGELFKAMTGVAMVHVPFKGSAAALTALLGNQVQVMFDNLPSTIGHVRGGRLRPLGVTTLERSAMLPDVPSISATVPGFEATSWFGLGVPRGTPGDVVRLLNREVNAVLGEDAMRAWLAEQGFQSYVTTPADFGTFLQSETRKWAAVVRSSGAKVE